MEKAIIVDLDGTLSNCEHRVHLVRQRPKNWKEFYCLLGEDTLNEWCAEIIQAMQAQKTRILLVTGRSDEYRELTLEWLARHQISFDELHMRGERDHRQDTLVKRDLYTREILGRYCVLFVLEDRSSVVAMWRELGLTCLQCDVGDF